MTASFKYAFDVDIVVRHCLSLFMIYEYGAIGSRSYASPRTERWRSFPAAKVRGRAKGGSGGLAPALGKRNAKDAAVLGGGGVDHGGGDPPLDPLRHTPGERPACSSAATELTGELPGGARGIRTAGLSREGGGRRVRPKTIVPIKGGPRVRIPLPPAVSPVRTDAAVFARPHPFRPPFCGFSTARG